MLAHRSHLSLRIDILARLLLDPELEFVLESRPRSQYSIRCAHLRALSIFFRYRSI